MLLKLKNRLHITLEFEYMFVLSNAHESLTFTLWKRIHKETSADLGISCSTWLIFNFTSISPHHSESNQNLEKFAAFRLIYQSNLQKYCETAYSRCGINQMWILKNSKELLEHMKSPTFNHVTSIKSFNFPTLYTTIPHQKWTDRLTSIIRNAFIFKNGNRRYTYLVLWHEETYFVKEHSDSKN